MRCYICNNEDDGISVDPQDHKFGPCFQCEEVIFDCVQSYPAIKVTEEAPITGGD